MTTLEDDHANWQPVKIITKCRCYALKLPLLRSVDTLAGRSEQQATVGGEAAQRRRYDDSVYVMTSCPLMRDQSSMMQWR